MKKNITINKKGENILNNNENFPPGGKNEGKGDNRKGYGNQYGKGPKKGDGMDNRSTLEFCSLSSF